MATEDAKDRLRQARVKRGLTRKVLAGKIGVSESAVRAHETGQNGIKPEAATKYAVELGVSAAWLLYGDHESDQSPSLYVNDIRRIVVKGRIRDGMWVKLRPDANRTEEAIGILLPQFRGMELSAYLVHSDDTDDMFNHYVVVAAEDIVGRYLVDEVVLTIKEGDLVETGLWKVGGDSEWDVFYRGESQKNPEELIKTKKGTPFKSIVPVVEGVVVARLDVLRQSAVAARTRAER